MTITSTLTPVIKNILNDNQNASLGFVNLIENLKKMNPSDIPWLKSSIQSLESQTLKTSICSSALIFLKERLTIMESLEKSSKQNKIVSLDLYMNLGEAQREGVTARRIYNKKQTKIESSENNVNYQISETENLLEDSFYQLGELNENLLKLIEIANQNGFCLNIENAMNKIKSLDNENGYSISKLKERSSEVFKTFENLKESIQNQSFVDDIELNKAKVEHKEKEHVFLSKKMALNNFCETLNLDEISLCSIKEDNYSTSELQHIYSTLKNNGFAVTRVRVKTIKNKKHQYSDVQILELGNETNCGDGFTGIFVANRNLNHTLNKKSDFNELLDEELVSRSGGITLAPKYKFSCNTIKGLIAYEAHFGSESITVEF